MITRNKTRKDPLQSFPESIVLHRDVVPAMHFMTFWHSYVLKGKMPEERVVIAICDMLNDVAPDIGDGEQSDEHFLCDRMDLQRLRNVCFLYGGVDGKTPLSFCHPRASIQWLASLCALRDNEQCSPDVEDVWGEITWELLPKESTIRYPQYRFLHYPGSKHVNMSDFPFYYHRSDEARIREIWQELFQPPPLYPSVDVMTIVRDSIVLSSIETVEF